MYYSLPSTGLKADLNPKNGLRRVEHQCLELSDAETRGTENAGAQTFTYTLCSRVGSFQSAGAAGTKSQTSD
jgi:hypothetical protein